MLQKGPRFGGCWMPVPVDSGRCERFRQLSTGRCWFLVCALTIGALLTGSSICVSAIWSGFEGKPTATPTSPHQKLLQKAGSPADLDMDPLEEQQQELEVLESIYPDELTKISDQKFTIRIALDTPSETKHAVILEVKYPPEYPEVIPHLDIEAEFDSEGVELHTNDDESEDEGPRLADLGELVRFESPDIRTLKLKLEEEAAAQIGMPSVFALTSQLKDEAESLFQTKLNKAQKDYETKLLAQEMEEQKKFHGTKVTRELWAEWRDKLRKELKIDERREKAYSDMHGGRLTGREIFEKGLAGNEDDLENEVAGIALTN